MRRFGLNLNILWSELVAHGGDAGGGYTYPYEKQAY